MTGRIVGWLLGIKARRLARHQADAALVVFWAEQVQLYREAASRKHGGPQ